MADRLYTSNDADEVLSALRFETKLEKATLARIAFALSIAKEGTDVDQSTSFTGGEMKRPTFIGEDEVFIRALISYVYQNVKSARTNFSPTDPSLKTTSIAGLDCSARFSRSADVTRAPFFSAW